MRNRPNNGDAVAPAKAGAQALNLFLRIMITTWIPAFAGMTAFAAFTNVQTPEDKILSQGFAAYMDGHDKMAQSYFEEVIRINPKNSAAQTGLEKVKIRLKKAEDTKKAKSKSFAKSKVREGRELLKTNDVVAAIDSFHAALDAVPGHKTAAKELKGIRHRTNKVLARRQLNLTAWSFARGVLAYLDRDWAKAYRIWSERLKVEPGNVGLANATARSENNFKKMMMSEQQDFFRRGARAFYEQGLYQEAKNSWEKVILLRPDDLEALEGKARTEEAILRAQGQGRDNQAHDLLEQGLDYYASQNWVKARETFEKLIALDPNFSTAQEYVAKINQQMSAAVYAPVSPSANRSWRDSKPSNQSDAPSLISDKIENSAESRKELESQLKRDPSNIRIQQELDKIIRSQEEESERIYKDGLIAYSQGNRSLAVQQWKQVLIIYPEHKKAAAALRKAMAEEERSATDAEEK